MAKDYSYLGSGNILVREYGSATPLVEVGNCSELTISPQEDIKRLLDNTRPGGGVRKQVSRVSDVNIAFRFHDFSPANFARFLRGKANAVVAGTATDELVVAYKGGFTALKKLAGVITTVEPAGGGIAYTVGTDYELRDGQLYIPSGSTITNPVSGAPNIQVTYTYKAQDIVQALTTSAKDYELVFIGINEAQNGDLVRITCHKVAVGLLSELGLIGEEFGGGPVAGSLTADLTKQISDVNASQFYTIETLTQ